MSTCVYDAGYVDYYYDALIQRKADITVQLDEFLDTNTDRFLESRIFTRYFIKA